MISGCSRGLALSKGQNMIDLSSASIALLSVRISNQNAPDYQPFPFMVFVDGAGSGFFKFSEDGPHRGEKNLFNDYLLSFNLKPGTSTFDKIWFDYHGAVIGARASIPMKLATVVKPGSVNYLGRMDVVIRPKKSDAEDSAGPSFPFINQATAGFSNGAYEVVIKDNFKEDMEWFMSEYPALKTVMVEKALLPQWSRPK
jgi:hypothetical protein